MGHECSVQRCGTDACRVASDCHEIGEIHQTDTIGRAPTWEDNSAQLSQLEKRFVEKSWNKLKDGGVETLGVSLLKNFFEIRPDLMALFTSFAKEPDVYQSPRLKAQAVKIITTL